MPVQPTIKVMKQQAHEVALPCLAQARTLMLIPASPDAIERILWLTARTLGAPIVCMLLRHSQELYVAAAIGLKAPWAAAAQTPDLMRLGQRVIALGQPLMMHNLREAGTLASSSGSFAGVPLCTDGGLVLGVLCAFDSATHSWSSDDAASLNDTAALAYTEIVRLYGNDTFEQWLHSDAVALPPAHQVEPAMLTVQRRETMNLLIGGAVHDFNNLIMAVDAYADLALLDAGSPGSVETYMQDIKAITQQAALLAKQLLAHSRAEMLASEIVDVHAVISSVIRLLRGTLPPLVSIDYQFAVPTLRISAVEVHIRQIILNLVRNASEAIETWPGSIQITTNLRDYTKHHVPDVPPGRYVVITISDTGCGMDVQTQRHIFNPYFTTKSTGHGLGLAAVRNIVGLHQGNITVESTVGRGTTFSVCFPAHE